MASVLDKLFSWLGGRIAGAEAVRKIEQAGSHAGQALLNVAAEEVGSAAQRALDAYKPQAVAIITQWADQAAAAGSATLTKTTAETGIQNALDRLPAAYAAPLQLATTIALAAVPDSAFAQLQAKGNAGIYQIAARIEEAVTNAKL